MLKIKDNVDLKELEKFGFEKREQRLMFQDYFRGYEKNFEVSSQIGDYKTDLGFCKITIHDEDSVCERGTIFIGGINKNKLCYGEFGVKDETLDLLFDLIKAGLVEKVEG